MSHSRSFALNATDRAIEVREFLDEILAAGMAPPHFVAPGRFYRFPGAGEHPSNRAGWCLLFEDGRGGCFGDWSSGFSGTRQAKSDKPCSPCERAAFARRVEAARNQAKAECLSRQREAANRAARIWSMAAPATGNHPYLIRKGIQPYGVRSLRKALVLPVRGIRGKLTSLLQFITADGGKQLLSGGRKRGCFIPVAGDWAEATRVILCEGWATGCTLAEDEPAALTLAAIDAGNLELVALAARCRWPSTELVIAGDDDRLTAGNPGAAQARAAAIAVGALVALPPWPADAPEYLTDFNDLALWLTGGEA